jgi:hypothetical protein
MNPSSPSLTFPSKIDSWIMSLMILPLGISIVVVGSALGANPPLPALFLLVGIEVLVLALIVGTVRSTRYEVTDREVIVRSPPFRWRIEIEAANPEPGSPAPSS